MRQARLESDAQDAGSPRALLVNGTVDVGKTTVAEAVSHVLAQQRVPNAVIDVDALRQVWPSSPDGPLNIGLALRNLTSVAANYVEAGIARLILAGVVETLSDRRAYETALGMPLTMCRLHGDPSVIRERLVRRHGDDKQALRWHLDRAPELDAILDLTAISVGAVV